MENFVRFQSFGKDITNSQLTSIGHAGHAGHNFGFNYISCSNGSTTQNLPLYCSPQGYPEYDPLCDP